MRGGPHRLGWVRLPCAPANPDSIAPPRYPSKSATPRPPMPRARHGAQTTTLARSTNPFLHSDILRTSAPRPRHGGALRRCRLRNNQSPYHRLTLITQHSTLVRPSISPRIERRHSCPCRRYSAHADPPCTPASAGTCNLLPKLSTKPAPDRHNHPGTDQK